MVLAQVLVLKSPMYGKITNEENENPEKLLPNSARTFISDIKKKLNYLESIHIERYMDLMMPDDPREIDPVSFIMLLINEYVEDCAYVLGIENMPDEQEFLKKKLKLE